MDEQMQTETPPSEPKPQNKANPMIIIAAIAALIVAGAAVLFYLNSNKGTTEEVSPVVTTPSQEPGATVEGQIAGDVLTVEIDARNFSFSPNAISAKLGQTIRVTLNSQDMQHDFMIGELSVNSGTVSSGESTTFEFAASEVGEFEFYCSVGNHRAMGMTGTLTVSQ